MVLCAGLGRRSLSLQAALPAVQRQNPGEGTRAGPPGRRAYGGAAALGGRVYALGGLQTDMTTYAPLVEVYDPAADAWAVLDVPGAVRGERGLFACAAWEP